MLIVSVQGDDGPRQHDAVVHSTMQLSQYAENGSQGLNFVQYEDSVSDIFFENLVAERREAVYYDHISIRHILW